jgi:hypothetical protein
MKCTASVLKAKEDLTFAYVFVEPTSLVLFSPCYSVNIQLSCHLHYFIQRESNERAASEGSASRAGRKFTVFSFTWSSEKYKILIGTRVQSSVGTG